MTGGWDEPRGYDHTFETGRVARLRVALPVTKLIREGVWTSEISAAFDLALAGNLDDEVLAMRLGDALVIGMFITPRVVADTGTGEELAPGCVPMSYLDESEMDETIRAALGGPAADPSFPGLIADDASDAGSGDVANAPVEPSGPSAGKRGSARSRRTGSKPAA